MKYRPMAVLALIILAVLVLPDLAFARAGGGGGGGGGSLLLYLICLPFILIYTAIMASVIRAKNNECKELIKESSRRDRLWDYGYMKERVKKTYFKVQEAWTMNDQDIAKEFMSERLYNKHKSQTDAMKSDGHRNVLEDITLREATIVEVIDLENDANDSFWVVINARMIDYTICERTGKIIKGDREKIEQSKELWYFARESHGWVLDEIKDDVSIRQLKSFNSIIERKHTTQLKDWSMEIPESRHGRDATGQTDVSDPNKSIEKE